MASLMRWLWAGEIRARVCPRGGANWRIGGSVEWGPPMMWLPRGNTHSLRGIRYVRFGWLWWLAMVGVGKPASTRTDGGA